MTPRPRSPGRQLFVTNKVKFCGQPIGLVLADTRDLARRASLRVQVHYSQQETPVLTIKDALKTQPEGLQQTKLCPVNVITGDADGE